MLYLQKLGGTSVSLKGHVIKNLNGYAEASSAF
jgi:hypothetical protein